MKGKLNCPARAVEKRFFQEAREFVVLSDDGFAGGCGCSVVFWSAFKPEEGTVGSGRETDKGRK